jgi:ubiquitin carboxyl-terminal hydrolase 25/28
MMYPELLAYCYYAQCRCNPTKTVEYFTSLYSIVEAMMPTVPQDLQSIILEERERLRFTTTDLAEAIRILGFGPNESLRIEYDTDVSDEFVESAWRETIKRAWHDPTRSAELQKAANNALRVVAESRGSVALRNLWNSSGQLVLTPDKAFAALEVPIDVDESMLIMVYEMRVGDF